MTTTPATKKNNKNLIIALVVIAVLGLIGYMVMGRKTTSPTQSGGMMQQSGSTPFTSIRDALSKSVSLECDFTDEGHKTHTSIKAGAVRADYTGTSAEKSGHYIMKDHKVYTWTDDKKEGMMMEIPDVTPGPQSAKAPGSGSNQAANPSEDFMKSIEKYKDSCHPAVVSDSLFTPPSDIHMTDYSQMMKGMQSPQNTQRMMQQYQTPEAPDSP